MRQNQNDGHLGFETLEDRLLLSTVVALVDTDTATAGLQPGLLILGDLAAGGITPVPGSADTIQVGVLGTNLVIQDISAGGLTTVGPFGAITPQNLETTNPSSDTLLIPLNAINSINNLPIQVALGGGDDTLNVGTAATGTVTIGGVPTPIPLVAVNFGDADVLIAGNAGGDTANIGGGVFDNLTLQDASGAMTHDVLQNLLPASLPNYGEGGADNVEVSGSVIHGDLGIGIGDTGTGDGADNILGVGLVVDGRVDVYTGAGNDDVIGVGNVYHGPVLINTGTGNDFLVGTGTTHDGLAQFDMGDGDDVIAYAGNTFNGGNVTHGGSGHDDLAQAGSADNVTGPVVTGFEHDNRDVTAALQLIAGGLDLDGVTVASVPGFGGVVGLGGTVVANATTGLRGLIDPLVT